VIGSSGNPIATMTDNANANSIELSNYKSIKINYSALKETTLICTANVPNDASVSFFNPNFHNIPYIGISSRSVSLVLMASANQSNLYSMYSWRTYYLYYKDNGTDINCKVAMIDSTGHVDSQEISFASQVVDTANYEISLAVSDGGYPRISQTMIFSGEVPFNEISSYGTDPNYIWCNTIYFSYVAPDGNLGQSIGQCKSIFLISVRYW
jgi:hypothetical protein